ncbi:MAG: cysteine desulfurase [Gemmatimonadetes bacterium]|nr:cysteine desulfurase [Gemmatimonadota bacterium]
MEPIYLDYAATTPVRREVREAMARIDADRFGNPSSVHRWGREGRAALEDARARLAKLLGASPVEIIFTRGGTEADNLAILGRARASRHQSVVCSAIEHRAVLASARAAEAEGHPLHILPVDDDGVVEVAALDAFLDPKPAVVSVMWVNNEVGTVQPVPELADRCRAAGVVFHTDAIQAFGKFPVRVDEVPVDLLSISAHKIGGPKGVGALFVRRGVELSPLIYGGSHEHGMRAGTEDVAGAVGFALAAELWLRDQADQTRRLGELRDRLEAGLLARIPDLVVNGAGATRASNILSISLPGVNSETLLVTLDLEGLAVSSGSACSSGAVTPSHVLTEMGIPDEVAGPSVRLSLGRETTTEEIDRVLNTLPPLVERMRALASIEAD